MSNPDNDLDKRAHTDEASTQQPGARIYDDHPVFPWKEGAFYGDIFGGSPDSSHDVVRPPRAPARNPDAGPVENYSEVETAGGEPGGPQGPTGPMGPQGSPRGTKIAVAAPGGNLTGDTQGDGAPETVLTGAPPPPPIRPRWPRAIILALILLLAGGAAVLGTGAWSGMVSSFDPGLLVGSVTTRPPAATATLEVAPTATPSPLSTATAVPTASAVSHPTTTPVPVAAPHLGVRPTQTTEICGTGRGGWAIPITVTNSGGQTLKWSARADDPGVTLSPNTGNLIAGASASVTLGGTASTPRFTVSFTSNGGGANVIVSCM